jgi:hypothetical protein
VTETQFSASPLPPRSAGAERMARCRRRRQKGMRCLMIEVRETEVDVLIRRRLLAVESRHDKAAVRRALYRFFDATLR